MQRAHPLAVYPLAVKPLKSILIPIHPDSGERKKFDREVILVVIEYIPFLTLYAI